MNNIFYLHWAGQKLFGWESEKSDLVVLSIMLGIEHRDDFPPVLVYRPDPEDFSTFHLSSRSNPNSNLFADGGHHRAVAHYIMGVPLKCQLHYPKDTTWYNKGVIEIPQIKLVRGWRRDFEQRRREKLAYRSLDGFF